MQTGLVLEGGGMRGMFTCGITDVLMEEGLISAFKGVVGVSAGAAFGCNIKSRQAGRAIRYNCKYMGDPRYMSFAHWLHTGSLFHNDFVYDTVPHLLDPFDWAAYHANPLAFHLVCTDIDTLRPVYHVLDDRDPQRAMQWIRATASLPLAAQPVDIDGRRLMDGGLSDSIPLRYFRQQGYGRNLVVLTQPRGYRKRLGRAGRLWRLLQIHRPGVARLMMRRPAMYNAQLDYLSEQEALGDTLILCPSRPLSISRLATDPVQLRRVYDEGRTLAQTMLPRIRQFLSREE